MRPSIRWHEEVLGAMLYALALGVETVGRRVIYFGRRMIGRLRPPP